MSLVGSVGRHIEALTSLAGEEAGEAAALYLRLAVMLGAALFFAAFGYVLVFISIAFVLAMVAGIDWIWILLGFAVFHLLLAFVCANHVRVHWRTPVFPLTKSEVSRDFAALRGADHP